MPPAKGKSRPLSSVLEGQVVLVQISDLSLTRKVLPDLATWTRCFAMYVSVVSMLSAGSAIAMMEIVTSEKPAVSSMSAVTAKALIPLPSVGRVGNQKSQNKQVNGTVQPTPFI